MARSAKDKKAASEARALRNPFTGEAPNSFTQSTNRDLPKPVNPRDIKPDASLRGRTRAAADDYIRGDANKAPMGYRMDAISPEYRTFATGMNHMMPNTAKEKGVPAINEPHEADSGVTVQRRAEDLSGREVKKGMDVLKQYGHDARDPMSSLKEVHGQALDHAAAQNIAAGVEESASQMFYGGRTSTDIPHDLDAQSKHEEGVMAANDRFHTGVRNLSTHPEFQRATGNFNHPDRRRAATNLMAQATSDTSPNAKWRTNPDAANPWPNMDQAEEAATSALENREPKFIAGRIQNVDKASARVERAVGSQDFDVHGYGDPVAATKTVAFRGALVDKDSPDAFKVSDVHEASVAAPWLDTAKPVMHVRNDAFGNQVGAKIPVYKDTPASQSKGLIPQTKMNGAQGGRVKEVPLTGLSRPEAMLAAGRSTVHALNDRATREVLSERGLSRGVNYADNVHAAQATEWGVQQIRRPDVHVSPADQHPISRDWHSEGVNVPKDHDIRNLPQGGANNLSAQFSPNTRTGNTDKIWPEAEPQKRA